MPKTTTYCPRCRQPVVAEVEQLFDTTDDSNAKQKLLGGNVNTLKCQSCGYQGMVPVPMVFHDAEKELLLTYFPPELGLPVNEQERLIGPMINKVLNRLPPEKRKAYLLRPQTMLTFDTMVEKVLEADGITKAMLEAQQKRLMLLQRLMASSPESRAEIINQEKESIDNEFFAILNHIIEASLQQGDQDSAKLLSSLQEQLFNETDIGRTLQLQAKEAEAAITSLQEASKSGLTRESLLNLIINAPTETRLSTLVSLTRSGMDYQFFQLLSEKIEKSQGETKEKLLVLRENLLEMTQKIDEAVNKRVQEAGGLLDEILNSNDIEKTFQQKINQIDEFFLEAYKAAASKAKQSGDLEKISKLQKVENILRSITEPPKEVGLIEQLIDAVDEDTRNSILETNSDQITPEFLTLFANIITQAEAQNQSAETLNQLQAAYGAAIKFSMKANLYKN